MSLDSARSEAARVAASVDLRDVRLFSLSSELVSPPEGGANLSFTLNADLRVSHEAGEDLLVVFGSYTLVIFFADDNEEGTAGEPSDDTRDVARFSFDLNALFAVEHQPEEPFSDSELTAFGDTTGQFALYPYARELVADLTGRMGLPILHLGVLRLNLDSRDG